MHNWQAAAGEPPYTLDGLGLMACRSSKSSLQYMHVPLQLYIARQTRRQQPPTAQHTSAQHSVQTITTAALQHRNSSCSLVLIYPLALQMQTLGILPTKYKQSIRNMLGTSLQMTSNAFTCNKQTAIQQQARMHTLLQTPISAVKKHPTQVCVC